MLAPAEALISLMLAQAGVQPGGAGVHDGHVAAAAAAGATNPAATLSSPFHLHFVALATLTALEAADAPDATVARDALRVLDDVRCVLALRERAATDPAAADGLCGETGAVFRTPGWDSVLGAMVEARLARGLLSSQKGNGHGQQQQLLAAPTEEQVSAHGGSGSASGQAHESATSPPPAANSTIQTRGQARQAGRTGGLGLSEQQSLQHLADLAVGAGHANRNGNGQDNANGGSSGGTGNGNTKAGDSGSGGGRRGSNANASGGPRKAGAAKTNGETGTDEGVGDGEGDGDIGGEGVETGPDAEGEGVSGGMGVGVGVGVGEGESELVMIDFTRLTRRGYLNVLAGL